MILVVGASHKTAPIVVRERLSIPRDQLPHFVARLQSLPDVKEAFVLSTCNRLEVYVATLPNEYESLSRIADAIERVLAEQAGPQVGSVLHQYIFRYTGDAAVRHLFRVASSLDSLVVGESQVLGQVKGAFESANRVGGLGLVLGRAVEWSFHVAKRVRTETHVGSGSVSVSSVAVELARQIFGSLDGRIVTLIGAGTMGEAAAKHLHAAGTRMIVVNRSPERAQSLADQFHGIARSWDQLLPSLAETDVAIASTGSQQFILSRELLSPIQHTRRGRSLFLIDIAVPRNIDPRVNQIDGVYLYDIDDLSKIAGESIRGRFREAQASERIVAQEADAFDAWLDSLQVTPTIVALRSQVRSVLGRELDRSLHGKLKHLSEQDRQALVGMMDAAVKKLTHHPTICLKSAASEGKARELVDALRHLFELDSKSIGERTSRPPSSQPPHNQADVSDGSGSSKSTPPDEGVRDSVTRTSESRNAHPEEAP